MNRVVVTISRQLGSGGAYIGQEVAGILGVRYVDREILAEVATILNEDPAVLAQRDERVSSFVESFLQTVCVGAPDAGYFPPPVPMIYDEQIFSCQARIIRKIASEESAVIVGRGGYHFLRGHEGVLNVFLHAPHDVRLRRIMELYRINRAEKAEEMITESDKARRKFNEKISGEKWGTCLCFDLCIDTEKAGFPLAIDTIVGMARRIRG
ncbi:cytidylate kinase-like family protein [Geomonas sp. RF6]|uniref:cytidylate kinase-like family protein n=1 Tax=Geomonas sp. RF6 TaxID=2897342 RepID=UPI001E3B1356|nr:cytidylate kinase-like family protein [Geomonas sp. RF6]UFS70078.1 cytidylate kinase-like family protein [Geomonas sp. RF6]